MSALVKVSVENMNQVVLSLVLGMAECTRSDRLGVCLLYTSDAADDS